MDSKFFKMYPGFCLACGAILPYATSSTVTCLTCKNSWPSSVCDGISSSFPFGTKAANAYESEKIDEKDKAEGPVVDRKCPQCGNDKMSYATLQLRSADEGQTVFYTCTKCKFKETENS